MHHVHFITPKPGMIHTWNCQSSLSSYHENQCRRRQARLGHSISNYTCVMHILIHYVDHPVCSTCRVSNLADESTWSTEASLVIVLWYCCNHSEPNIYTPRPTHNRGLPTGSIKCKVVHASSLWDHPADATTPTCKRRSPVLSERAYTAATANRRSWTCHWMNSLLPSHLDQHMRSGSWLQVHEIKAPLDHRTHVLF